jgi:hypothetical protein
MSGYFVQIRRIDSKKWTSVAHFSDLSEATVELEAYRRTRAKGLLSGDPQFRIAH